MVLAMTFSASVRPTFVKAARPQQMRSGRRSVRVCAKVRAQQPPGGPNVDRGDPLGSPAGSLGP